MPYRYRAAVAIATVAGLCACADQPTTPVEDAASVAALEPRMASSSSSSGFFDSFNSFNSSHWRKSDYPIDAMIGGIKGGWSHKPANVEVQNGLLKLTLPARSFNSGQIETKATYRFGAYSATITCPDVTAAYCTVYSYDHSGDEIDIEIYRLWGRWNIEFTVKAGGENVCTNLMTPTFNPSTAMHTYRYDYSSGTVRFYVDGKERTTAACSYSRGRRLNPPTSRMTFLLAAWWPAWMHGSQPSTAKRMYVESASYAP